MKQKSKNILRGMAKHIGLKVKFVSYFDDDIHGKLLPREKRILINAHKPRCEHVFTLLHEIGHYLNHVLNPGRRHHPRIFDLQLKSDLWINLSSKIRRYFRFVFNRTAGKEWEADLWAFCAFLYLAKAIGCRADLSKFLELHPEKYNTFFLAALGFAYSGVKTRIQNIFKTLSLPFRIH